MLSLWFEELVNAEEFEEVVTAVVELLIDDMGVADSDNAELHGV